MEPKQIWTAFITRKSIQPFNKYLLSTNCLLEESLCQALGQGSEPGMAPACWSSHSGRGNRRISSKYYVTWWCVFAEKESRMRALGKEWWVGRRCLSSEQKLGESVGGSRAVLSRKGVHGGGQGTCKSSEVGVCRAGPGTAGDWWGGKREEGPRGGQVRVRSKTRSGEEWLSDGFEKRRERA